MRKFLILAMVFISVNASAQTAAEEAIILNQELQYLEDSVNSVQAISVNAVDTTQSRNEALSEESLEKTYFGEVEEDSVSTRTAGQKRRGL